MRRSNRYLLLLAAMLLAGGCTEEIAGTMGTTSLRLIVTAPADLGSADMRLPDGMRTVTLDVTALDEQGLVDTSFNGPVVAYVHFLGTLTPLAIDPPVQLTAGVGSLTVDLPIVYGVTFLWIEDPDTLATGTSERIWFREPYLQDVSRPVDEMSSLALQTSPLEKKQVLVTTSRHGVNGHLVVTGVYAQGYTVSDVDCSASPCVAGDYDHMLVFTFGRPRAEDFTAIQVGHEVAWVSGGVGEFNGLTELNFPQTGLVVNPPDPSLLPAPTPIDAMWLSSPSGPDGMINLERLESGLVSFAGGVVCPLDNDFTMYGQWKLDVGFGCSDPLNVITKGTVNEFDPAAYLGQTIPLVVGTLRAVNIGSFHVWMILPRTIADLTLP